MQLLLTTQPCGRCRFAIPIWSDVCRRCGLALHSPRRLRAAGVLYLALGVLLSAAGAYLIVLIGGIVGRSDDPHATTRFIGSVGDAVFVFGALGLVLLLGILAVLMGIWQILHGRRNLALVRVVIVFYLFFWVGAVLVQLFG